MLVTAERVTKQVTYVEREVPPPPKPPWKIHTSIFAARQRESDGKAFFDTEAGEGVRLLTRHNHKPRDSSVSSFSTNENHAFASSQSIKLSENVAAAHEQTRVE